MARRDFDRSGKWLPAVATTAASASFVQETAHGRPMNEAKEDNLLAARLLIRLISTS